jgi:hypothetical protein
MLAVALSGETEARVMLAAFDVSRPSLAKRFGVHPEPGAVDRLKQSATMRVIGGGPSGRLGSLPAGSRPRGGMSRFVHLVSVSDFFESCRQAFGWTVLDLPVFLTTQTRRSWSASRTLASSSAAIGAPPSTR